jgi:DNA polymerase III subunit delta
MPELKYDQLSSYLKERQEKPYFPVYLIYGDELLCKTAFNALLNSMIPVSKQSLNYDPVDDAEENIHQIIERVNTFSLQPGPKAVALIDSKIFYAKQDDAKLLAKAREAYDRSEPKKAAGFFVALLGRLNLVFEDLATPEGIKKLKGDPAEDVVWIEALCDYCKENNIRILKDQDSAAALDKGISKGFPKNNHLFITTDMTDRRRSLFKTILKTGLVVDCSVPKGDRRDDRIAQEAVMNKKMESILSQSGKSIAKDVFAAITEMTGFDLRTFSHNLEKLINFVGKRHIITVDDVEAVLERTRKDPIYEMTNAVAERDTAQALYFLEAMLSENIHPLQILAAISNQIRKLIMAKGFLEGEWCRSWNSNMNFTQFKRNVMPEIQAYDRQLLDQLLSWQDRLLPEKDKTSGGSKKKKGKPATDLIVAKNPNNAYPVYQTMLKADGYSRQEILMALACLARADVKLKTTAQKPKTVLEAAVFSICERSREP